MHLILPTIALLAVCADAANFFDETFPNEQYLSAMCYPNSVNRTVTSRKGVADSMANSPFPCEQRFYLELICLANGTTPNDFLAEQQCLCGGNYFETGVACYDCYRAHGYIPPPSDTNRADVLSAMSSRSTAECSASPITQGYTNLWPFVSSIPFEQSSDITLSSDRFPNDTRVANYWTGATAPIVGKITGSAVQHQSSFTNSGGSRFTPTAAAVTGGSATTPSSPSSTGSADATTSTGGAAEARVAGGLLAAVIGVLAVL